MKCSEYVELMSEYLDRELSAEDCRLWESHFQDCPPCKTFFESFRSSVELLDYMRRDECPQAVAERLERLVQEKAREKASSGGSPDQPGKSPK